MLAEDFPVNRTHNRAPGMLLGPIGTTMGMITVDGQTWKRPLNQLLPWQLSTEKNIFEAQRDALA